MKPVGVTFVDDAQKVGHCDTTASLSIIANNCFDHVVVKLPHRLPPPVSRWLGVPQASKAIVFAPLSRLAIASRRISGRKSHTASQP